MRSDRSSRQTARLELELAGKMPVAAVAVAADTCYHPSQRQASSANERYCPKKVSEPSHWITARHRTLH